MLDTRMTIFYIIYNLNKGELFLKKLVIFY